MFSGLTIQSHDSTRFTLVTLNIRHSSLSSHGLQFLFDDAERLKMEDEERLDDLKSVRCLFILSIVCCL